MTGSIDAPETESPPTARRRGDRLRRAAVRLWTPPVAMGAVLAFSLGARLFELDVPRERGTDKGFVFDEKYYVNAARVIAGVAFPSDDTYHGASPNGTDPNAEHPQLAKLVIAGGIRLLGDNPIGWRLGAVLFGTLTLLALYALVRAMGGSRWLAVGAAALMATENLELVHARIAVLDVYALPFMLGGVALFLRRRPILAGVMIGVGTDMKLFGGYALFAVLLYEGGRFAAWSWRSVRASRGGTPAGSPAGSTEQPVAAVLVPATPRPPGRRVWGGLCRGARGVGPAVLCTVATVVSCLLVLAVLDHVVPAWSGGHRVSADLRPWRHLQFMYDYGKNLRSPQGPKGIASYPWQFWVDVEPANYYSFNEILLVGTRTTAINTVVAYQGVVDPVILVTWAIALPVALWSLVRRGDRMAGASIAWVLATWLPALAAWLLDQRTEYLYYMVVILPGVLIPCAALLGSRRLPRLCLGIWIGVHAAAFCVLYPFRDWASVASFFHVG